MPHSSSPVALALIGLLLLCPVLCGPGEGRCTGECEQQDNPVRQNAPEPCDEGGDNCICQGATLSSWLNAGPKAGFDYSVFNFSAPTASLKVPSPAERFGPSSLRVSCTTPDGSRLRLLIQSWLS